MPLYNFRCATCKQTTRKLMKVEAYEALESASIQCKCGGAAKREMQAASSQTMEVLDNGLVARRVERLSEAERIFKEREIAHDLKYGQKDYENE